MTEPMTLTDAIIDSWASDSNGPVALHLKQKLVPVEEGEHAVIFPPTYADIGYNIDSLSDGTKVVTIDSVGSQANRIEPIFKVDPYSALIPQIEIEIEIKPDRKDKEDEPYVVKRSLLDLAHRSADATVYASPMLSPKIRKAFMVLNRRNDAGPLCWLAPTSLLFGVWDSRGGSGEKRPRIIRSIIRAWNVDLLHDAAQFNSIRKTLDEDTLNELKQAAKEKKKKLSDIGLDDAPAVFRRLKGNASNEMPEYRNGHPNPERRVLGGVLVAGPIERDVTVNLVALRKLEGEDGDRTKEIHRYILSIALLAETADFDLYLREGCHLRYASEDQWYEVPRRGERVLVDLTSDSARRKLLEYAKAAVGPFKLNWPDMLVYQFDLNEAKKLLAKKTDEEDAGD